MSGISRNKDETTGKVSVKFSVKMRILKPFVDMNFNQYLYGYIENENVIKPTDSNVPIIKVTETDLPPIIINKTP